MNSKLKMLCELYDRSDEDINVDALLKVCFFKELKEVLILLSHKQQVKFAYLCAKSVFHLSNKKTKEKAEKCLELVEEWLENPNSISYNELRKAAYVTHAAYATCAADAVAYSAYAAANAANVAYAADAANAAIYATLVVRNKQKQEYKNLCFLVKVIRDEF